MLQRSTLVAKLETFSQRRLLKFSAEIFDKQIVEVYKPAACVCTASVVCACECVCVALFIDACRTVGIQRRLLNYMCTKTAGFQTRRASLPASRRVGQAPGSASTNAAPVYFSCFCLIPSFFCQLTCFQASQLWRRTFHFSSCKNNTNTIINQKKKRTNTDRLPQKSFLLVSLIVDR